MLQRHTAYQSRHMVNLLLQQLLYAEDTTQHLLSMVASTPDIGQKIPCQINGENPEPTHELGLYIVSAEMLTHGDFQHSIYIVLVQS